MKVHFFVFALMCTVSVKSMFADEAVQFRDSMLKEAIEAELGVQDPTASDMLELTRFVCTNTVNDGISSISGLEYAKNLEYLKLSYNEISSISALSSLKSLTDLIINDNCISSLSALSGLKSLSYLDVHKNELTSLSGLSGLDSLEVLIARTNQISSISGLSGCTNLYKLRLQGNEIESISVLSGLKKLDSLSLNGNDISSVSALSALNQLSKVYLSENNIESVSALTSLTNLDVLTLSENSLGDGAYCDDLHRIEKNNPGINLTYSANDAETPNVNATKGAFQDRIRITWGGVCTGPNYDRYYQVLRGTGNDGIKTPVSAWISEQTFDDHTAERHISYTYWVQGATSSSGSNRSDLSEPSIGRLSDSGVLALTINALIGGSVVTPGQGAYEYDSGTVVTVVAQVSDANGYFFTGWKGTSVDKGLVADPNRLSTSVTVRSSGTLRATFATNHNRFYVDGQAADPNKDGTYYRPFDSIQEAIDTAEDGMTVIVRPGVYSEVIQFNDKQITVSGINPDDPNAIEPYPVIDGDYAQTPVSFVSNETFQSVLTGFVITRGNGAIYCNGSSPTIANCLIVGNLGDEYGAIECLNSDAVISNCTIADNRSYGLRSTSGDVLLTSSILWNNIPKDLLVTDGSLYSVRYCNLSNPAEAHTGNLGVAPLFTDPGLWQQGHWITGDYHLSSKIGRWDPQAGLWDHDIESSLCIDAGDPDVLDLDEPAPNGYIINMGAYGGTNQASMSTL